MQRSVSDLEQVVERAEHLLQQAKRSGDDGSFDGIALNLHGFYTGVEAIFEDIARTLEGSVPSSPNWHQELLQQMSAEMTGVRPPVISTQTRWCLDEYRSFRHVVRNLYTFNLRPDRVERLCTELRACYESVRTDLDGFCDFVLQLDEA